jgi:hypothetical protein
MPIEMASGWALVHISTPFKTHMLAFFANGEQMMQIHVFDSSVFMWRCEGGHEVEVLSLDF